MTRFDESIEAIKARRKTLEAMLNYYQTLEGAMYRRKLEDLDRELAPLLAKRNALVDDYERRDEKALDVVAQMEGQALELKRLEWQKKTYRQPMNYKETNREKVLRLASELARLKSQRQSLEAASSAMDSES